MDKVEHSWELYAPRGDRNEFRSTLRWQRAPRATRRIGTMVNASEKCYKIRHSPRRGALPWLAEGFSPTAYAG
jgi:hypothetical protein